MKTLTARCLVLFALCGLAACGGKTATKTTMTRPAATQSGAQAPIPANLACVGSGPVWVNARLKVYHLPGDVYYGRTRNGVYMCEKDAISAGDRPAHSYK